MVADQRLLTIRGLFGLTCHAVGLDHPGPFTLVVHPDESGSIVVGAAGGIPLAGISNAYWGDYRPVPGADLRFELIEEPKTVMQLIGAQRKAHKRKIDLEARSDDPS